MPLMDLTNDNFDDEIDRHRAIVLNFWGPFCGPCKMFEPVYQAAAAKYPDVLFARINVQEEPDLAKQFDVMSTPTLLAIKDGTIETANIGALPPARFESFLKFIL